MISLSARMSSVSDECVDGPLLRRSCREAPRWGLSRVSTSVPLGLFRLAMDLSLDSRHSAADRPPQAPSIPSPLLRRDGQDGRRARPRRPALARPDALARPTAVPLGRHDERRHAERSEILRHLRSAAASGTRGPPAAARGVTRAAPQERVRPARATLALLLASLRRIRSPGSRRSRSAVFDP